MGCAGKISLLLFQLLIFLLVAFAVTSGGPYLTADKYSPGDIPNSWFKVVVVENNDGADKEPSYSVYRWDV